MMRPCLVMCQLLIFFMTGESLPNTRNLEESPEENGLQDIEYQIQVSENSLHSVIAFMPATSCHVQFSKDSGTFSPPVFYGTLDVNLWCNWTILAAPGKHIVVYIDGFTTDLDCEENQDEIIFQGVSSSVEATIVYACWKKSTHIYATQAHAVNVLFLWRTFSHTGSQKMFEGRYFIFDDPTAVPGPCNCSLKLNKSMTERTIDSKEAPVMSPPLYSPVPPALPPSTIIYDQEPKSTTVTSQATSYEAPNLTEGTPESGLLRDVSTTIKKPVKTSPTYSEYTDTWPVEDLQPSHAGQWEHSASSIWRYEIPSSQSASETPKLSIALATGILEASQIRITPQSEIPGTRSSLGHMEEHFSMGYTADHGILHQASEISIPATAMSSQYHNFTKSSEVLVETFGLDSNVTQLLITSSSHLPDTPEQMTRTLVASSSIFVSGFSQGPFSKTSTEAKFPVIDYLSKASMTPFAVYPTPSSTRMMLTPQPVPTEIPGTVPVLTHSSISHLSDLIEPILPLQGFPEVYESKPTPDETLSLGHQGISPNRYETTTLLTTISFSQSSEPHVDLVSTPTKSWQLNSVPAATETLSILKADGQNTETSTPYLIHLPPALSTSLELGENWSSGKNPFQTRNSFGSQASVGPQSVFSGTGTSLTFIVTQASVGPQSVSSDTAKSTRFFDSQVSVGPQSVPSGTTTPSPFFSSQASFGPQSVSSDTAKSSRFFGSQVSVGPQSVPSGTTTPSTFFGSQASVGPQSVSSRKVLSKLPPESLAGTLPSTELDNYPELTSVVTPTISVSTLHGDMVVLGQQVVSGVLTTSPPSPGLSVKPTGPASPKEKLSKMEAKGETSTKEYKPTESLNTETSQLDSQSATHIFHDSTHENKITTPGYTSTANVYVAFLDQLFKSLSSPFKTEDQKQKGTSVPQPTNHQDNGKGTQTAFLDQDENSMLTYTGHESDRLDVDPREDAWSENFDDDMDTVNVSIDQSDLGVPHNPGDSLFELVSVITHQHVSLTGREDELVESLKAKITEKMKSFPGGVHKLILKNVTLTNLKTLTMTLWLHLKSGGNELGNFIMTQVQTLEKQPIGSLNATLEFISIEDVNECQLGIHNCDNNAHCENVVGTYLCHCMSKYEDHSPDAPGTLCIATNPEETRSLEDHLWILIASIASVGGTLVLVLLLLCTVHLRRHAKVHFNLQKAPRPHQGAHFPEAIPVYSGEQDENLPHLARHMASRHSKEPLTARDTSSTLELTNITFEQTAI